MDLLTIAVSWFPMLLLIAVWIFFMRQMRGKGSPAEQSLAEMRRHNDALEKILANYEHRLQKLENDRGDR